MSQKPTPTFFPRQTIVWHQMEPSALRKLTLSVVEMALITGVLLRLFRALALTHGPSDSWLFIGGRLAIGGIFLFGMLTLHLSNFTLRRWTWRAPLFALLEAATEVATSAVLIWLEREPLGTSRAEMSDWTSMAVQVLIWRMAAVLTYALILAGIVQVMRRVMLRLEHRTSTAEAIHHGHERRSSGAADPTAP